MNLSDAVKSAMQEAEKYNFKYFDIDYPENGLQEVLSENNGGQILFENKYYASFRLNEKYIFYKSFPIPTVVEDYTKCLAQFGKILEKYDPKLNSKP